MSLPNTCILQAGLYIEFKWERSNANDAQTDGSPYVAKDEHIFDTTIASDIDIQDLSYLTEPNFGCLRVSNTKTISDIRFVLVGAYISCISAYFIPISIKIDCR